MKEGIFLHEIKAVTIENTTLCGADCIMCTRNNLKYKNQTMDFELFKKSVDDATSYGVKCINLCGQGDPVMDNNFIRELEYIKTKYPSVNVATNTTCHVVQGEKLEAICKYVDEMFISMYGVTKETYEAVHRGALKFEKVKQNIDTLLNRKQKPFIIMGFVVVEENERELDKWISDYKDRADRLDVWRKMNWGGTLPNEDKDKPYVKCFRIDSLNGLYIRTDGSVTMCCMDYNRNLKLGNIKNESFSDIVNGDFARNMQKINNDGSIKDHPICKDCDQIRDRSDALIFSTDKNMSVGKHSLFFKEKIFAK